MIRTVEAIIDESGAVRLLEDIRPPEPCRALVTILEEAPAARCETAIMGEAALSDWNRPEEEAAWSHLQPVR